jgi:hypothetical protein
MYGGSSPGKHKNPVSSSLRDRVPHTEAAVVGRSPGMSAGAPCGLGEALYVPPAQPLAKSPAMAFLLG